MHGGCDVMIVLLIKWIDEQQQSGNLTVCRITSSIVSMRLFSGLGLPESMYYFTIFCICHNHQFTGYLENITFISRTVKLTYGAKSPFILGTVYFGYPTGLPVVFYIPPLPTCFTQRNVQSHNNTVITIIITKRTYLTCVLWINALQYL